MPLAASKPVSRAPAQNTTGVRRNLFHHHLSRRPTSASTSSSSATQQREVSKDEETEIVARKADGSFAVSVPVLRESEEDQLPDEIISHERDKLEAKMLAQLYKDRDLHPDNKIELMAALQASLKRRVAYLDDDNWIFEAEQPSQDA